MLFQVLCGFEPIFYTTHPNEEPFFAVILFQLHILFWLADFLLSIYCPLIVNGVDKFDKIYFENTASFLESRYTQY